MATDPNLSNPDENPVDEAIAKYMQRVDAGEQVDQGEFAAGHPEIADQLLEYFRLSNELGSAGVDRTVDHTTAGISPNPASINPPVSGSTTIGPYKLLQQIGEGGMGTVWMAEQEEPVRRRVALKLIRSEVGSKETIARFEAERQALAMMEHQNIAKILDAGTMESGSPYFVMELVEGIPFNQFCDKNKLSVQDRLDLFIPVCEAVQHAHQKGIIHRDLKPSNVLVTFYDGKPIPKVIDFGLAKALEHTTKLTDKTMFTEIGKVVGTLQYMSPEQAELNALDVDTRTDVYSLGVMLYELLTGSTPLDKEALGRNALLEVLKMIREQEPPRPSTRLSSAGADASGISQQRKIAPAKLQQILRGELDWIVMKSLEIDRTRRYETASAFADDIRRYLADETVEARPSSAGYRIGKFIKKNRGWVATAAAVLASLIVAIVGTSLGLIEANAQREVAEQKTTEALLEKEKATASEKRAIENKRLAVTEASNARAAEAAALKSELQTEATFARLNLFSANSSWEADRVNEANQFLHSVPNLDQYRNIEWRLLRNQILGSDITCYGHSKSVRGVAFSPDGKYVASASEDATIKLWDAVSGAEIRTFPSVQIVRTVAFSPDGVQLAGQVGQGIIKLWDVQSGNELMTLTARGWIRCLAFSPDSTYLAAGTSSSNIAKIWNVHSGAEQTTLRGHSDWIASVTFSPDGKRLATGSHDQKIKLWDVSSGKEEKSLDGHTRRVQCVAFSPDGDRLVTGSEDRQIKLWDASSGNILKTLSGHLQTIKTVAFSPDGTRVASGSRDGTIRFWDAETGSQLQTLKGHRGFVESLAFSPDGTRLVSGSGDKTIKIWSIDDASGQKSLAGHSEAVGCVAFSHDGTVLATGSNDSTIRLWNVRTGVEQATLGHQSWISCVAMSPDGAVLANGNWGDSTVKLWDAKTGIELKPLLGHTGPVRDVAFSPDGKNLFTASDDTTIKVWDIQRRVELQTLQGQKGGVETIDIGSDGKYMASGSKGDGIVRLWGLKNLKEPNGLAGHTGGGLKDVAFSPDGKRLASVGHDRKLKLWDVESGIELMSFECHPGRVSSVSFSPDGTRLVTSGMDKTIRFWDAENGNELKTIIGYTSPVVALAISPDGNHLATGSWNRIVKLWDLRPESELKVLAGHNREVVGVSFSPDSKLVYSQDKDDKRIVWDAESGKQLDDVEWKNIDNNQWVSPDNRWRATLSGHDVTLVDLKFKSTPDEKAYRQFKARPKPYLHAERAAAAQNKKDWYAATFHLAWILKSNPDDPLAYDQLHKAYKKLASNFANRNKELTPYLHPIVIEMLKLPRNSAQSENEPSHLEQNE